MPISDEQLRELIAAGEKATPRPWTHSDDPLAPDAGELGAAVCSVARGRKYIIFAPESGGSYPMSDRDFIIRASNLASELARLELERRERERWITVGERLPNQNKSCDLAVSMRDYGNSSAFREGWWDGFQWILCDGCDAVEANDHHEPVYAWRYSVAANLPTQPAEERPTTLEHVCGLQGYQRGQFPDPPCPGCRADRWGGERG